MSSLNLSHNTILQSQKEREGLRSQYMAKSIPGHSTTIPAPAAPTAPTAPTALMTGPVPLPSTSMWSPEMGIKFGGPSQLPGGANLHNPAYPRTWTGQTQGGHWTPNQGLKFS